MERTASSAATATGQDAELTIHFIRNPKKKKKNLNLPLSLKSLLQWHGHWLLTKTVPAIKFEVKFAYVTLLCKATLNFSWESVFFSLCVPFFNPGKWAKTFVAFTEIFTWFVFFSLHFTAPMIVNVALPAVPATSTNLTSCPDQLYLTQIKYYKMLTFLLKTLNLDH
jgi:hypothetical protein